MPSDRRTLWLAGGAWLGASVGWVLPGLRVPPLPAGAILGVAVVVLAVRWRAIAPVVVIALAAALAALLGADVRQPPPDLGARTCDITAVVTGTPRQVATAVGQEPVITIPLTLQSLRSSGLEWSVDLPARARVTVSDLTADLRPGQQLSFRGRVAERELLRAEVPVQVEGAVTVAQDPGGVFLLGDVMRGNLDQAIRHAPGGEGDAAALVAGIALGDEADQRPELARWMQQSGLAHLTAVSGGNFTIFVGAIVLAARVIGLGLGIQWAAGASALIAYAVVVGPQPSVLRAAVMAAIGLLGVLLGGPSRGLPVLGAAVTVLLLISPELAWSIGFMLSVAATAALQILTHPVASRLAFLPVVLRLPLAVAVSAQLATAPILLAAGAAVSWVAVPANLVAAPVVAPVTLLGILAAVLGAFGGAIAAVPALVGAEVIVQVAAAATRLVHSSWSSLAGQGASLLLIGWAVVSRLPSRWRPLLAAAVGMIAVWTLGRSLAPQDWRLIACDVGQGSAVLINTAPGTLMVDTGPPDADLAGCLGRTGVTGPDWVVLSHHHIDHVGGLPRLLSVRRPDALFGPAGAPASATENGVQSLSVGSGGLRELAAGERYPLGSVALTVLWPPPGRRTPDDEVNNGSAVLLIEWADGVRAVLPGDVEPESQRRLMAGWQLPPVDVLLIPHHGSDHQDPRFAPWIAPAVAIASAGQGNSYGHPAAQTLGEYEAAGATVWRTDLAGTVTVSIAAGGELAVSEG